MTLKWNELSEAQKDRMARAFDVLVTADAVVLDREEQHGAASKTTTVRIDDLYQLVTRPDLTVPQHVNEELRRNPKLRKDLEHIMKQVSISHFPVAAAAASDDYIDRESGAFTIKLRPTQRRADQVYLLVQCKEGVEAPVPRKLLARRNDGSIAETALPEPVDGLSQLLLSTEDTIFLAIADRKTVLDVL